jgi:hypothetical protein
MYDTLEAYYAEKQKILELPEDDDIEYEAAAAPRVASQLHWSNPSALPGPSLSRPLPQEKSAIMTSSSHDGADRSVEFPGNAGSVLLPTPVSSCHLVMFSLEATLIFPACSNMQNTPPSAAEISR